MEWSIIMVPSFTSAGISISKSHHPDSTKPRTRSNLPQPSQKNPQNAKPTLRTRKPHTPLPYPSTRIRPTTSTTTGIRTPNPPSSPLRPPPPLLPHLPRPPLLNLPPPFHAPCRRHRRRRLEPDPIDPVPVVFGVVSQVPRYLRVAPPVYA